MKYLFFGGAALLAFSAPGALAQQSTRATDAVYACATITSDTERLACFDHAVSDLKAAEDAGTVRTVDNAEIQKIEKEAFGFSMPNLRWALRGLSGDDDTSKQRASAGPAAEEINEVTLNIARISKQPVSNRLTIYLEDGQVWEQVDSRKLPGGILKNPKQAEIRRAALRSYMMSIDGSVAIRVKRTS